LPFRELAESLEELITDARANRTSPERMRGGTFTVTNIGVFGVEGATPIINPGESAILALGQIQRRPWAHKDQIALRSVATLSLSFDHRLVDGELGSKVLTDIARLLERPSRAFAW
jgi:2-oxoisovalerate dehydrogenase E2 component (dihydrolipoyl transacylase)